jgi:hypothetical protein
MPDPFNTLADLIQSLMENALASHGNNDALTAIAKGQIAIVQAQDAIRQDQAAIKDRQSAMQDDLLSIKAYIGAPDVRFGATQDELDSLAARMKKQTDDVAAFERSVTQTDAPPSQ